MPDRTGELSSFPTSLDQFSIKKPFDTTKALSQQELGALEQASHMNHMFDSVYKIESYLLSGSGGAGGVVVSRWASGITGSGTDVYGSNLRLNYTTVSISMTGNTISVTGLVPSGFGNNPFDSKGFALSHSLYVTNPNGSSTTEGVWANKSWGANGPFNETLKWFQFFTMIRPVSGRIYELTVKNLPYHSTSDSISSDFTDSMKPTAGLQIQNIYDRSGWDGQGLLGLYVWNETTPGLTYWYGLCELGNSPYYGWCWPTKLGKMSDSYVEWGEIAARYATPETNNECYTRIGPMVRANGTVASANFYCIAIGDVPRTAGGLTNDKGMYGRILKVTGANLSNEGASTPDGGGTTWGGNPTISYIGTGASGSSGYYWFGDSGVRFRLKCETVPGSAQITVQQAVSPYSSWTTLYGPFYDGSSPLASGYSGFFSQAMNGDDDRWIKFLGSVTVGNLLSNTTISAEVKMMFMLIGPEDNLTMEVGS